MTAARETPQRRAVSARVNVSGSGFEGCVQLISRHELVYVTATLTYRGTTVEIADVLVDTGAATTVINADLAADAGIYLGPSDQLRRLRGVVGGHEHVFMRDVAHSAEC